MSVSVRTTQLPLLNFITYVLQPPIHQTETMLTQLLRMREDQSSGCLKPGITCCVAEVKSTESDVISLLTRHSINRLGIG